MTPERDRALMCAVLLAVLIAALALSISSPRPLPDPSPSTPGAPASPIRQWVGE